MARRSRLLISQVALLGALAALVLGVGTAGADVTGPPVSTGRPIVTGSAGVGKTLRTTNGSWSTSATFTYQWLRCVTGYRGCANLPGQPTYTVIPGATAATYVPVAADAGHVLEARVTATNAAGSTSVLSSGKGPVEAKPPGVKHKPWIAGTKKAWETVSETDDRWTRSPYMWTYRWLRCSARGDACVLLRSVQCSNGFCIREPGGSEYELTGNDVGHRIRVEVTAWNGAGRTTSISRPTRLIKK